MKLPILALTACLLSAACQNTADAPEAQAPETTPAPAPEVTAPAEKTSERVQPEIRYYEIADT